MAELARLSLGAAALHEPKPNLFGLGKATYESQTINELHRQAFETSRFDLVKSAVDLSGCYFESSPQITFMAEVIAKHFPAAKFIHVIRHPGDVVRSGMRRKWYDGSDNDRWRIVPKSGEFAEIDWNKRTAFEKNVWSWVETNRWIESLFRSLPETQTIVIRSEDIFNGDEAVLNSFFDFLNVPMPDKRRIRSVLGLKHNSQKTGRFPSCDDWSPEQKSLLLDLADSLLEEHHYGVQSI